MIAKLSIRLLGVLAVTIGLGLAVLQIPWVQGGISRGLAAALSEPGEFELRIRGFGGFLPFTIRADELSLVDSEGAWLSVSSLRLDVIPSELWRGRIVLRRVLAEQLRLVRLPVSHDETDEDGGVPAFLRVVLLGELDVFDLRVGPSLLPMLGAGDAPVGSASAAWSPPVEVRAHGRYYFRSRSGMAELSVTLDAVDGGALLSDEASVSAARLDLSVRGSLDSPVLKASLEFDDARLLSAKADRLGAVVEIEAVESASSPSLAVKLAVEFGGVDSADLRLQQLLGDSPSLSAQALVDHNRERVVLESAQLRGAEAELALHGRIESMRDLLLEVEAELDDLAILSGLVSQPISGRGQLRASIEADLSSGVASAETTVSMRGVDAGSPAIRALLGDRARAVGRVARSHGGELSVEDFELSAVGGEVSGHLRYQPDNGRLSGLLAARVSDVSDLARSVGSNASGDLLLRAQLEGDRDDISIDAAVVTNGLTIANLSTVSGRLGVRARGSIAELGGDASLLLSSGSSEAVASADFGWNSSAGLELNELQVDGNGVHLSGALTVSAEDRLVSGQLLASLEDLSLFAPLAEFALGGSATLKADFGVAAGQQLVDVNVVGEDVVAQPHTDTRLELGRGELSLQVRDASGQPLSKLGLRATGARFGDVIVDAATLDVVQAGNQWQTQAEVSGRYFDAFEVSTSSVYESRDDGWQLLVDGFEGSIADTRVFLGSALTVASDGRGFSINGLDLEVADGRVGGDWDELSGPQPVGAIRITDLPLDVLHYYQPALDVHGRINGELKAGSLQTSSTKTALAELWLEGTGVEVVNTRHGETLPIEARLELQRYPTGLSARMEIDTGVGEGLSIVAQLPLVETSAAHRIVVDRNAEVVGRVEGTASLDRLLALGEDAVDGEASVDLTLSGSLDDPRLQGTATVGEGLYTSAATGVAYRDIDLSIAADGLNLRLVSLDASDGRSGSLRASGELDLSAGIDEPSYRVAVELTKMRILNLDELEVKAGGVLEVMGGNTAARISGRLDVAKAEVTLPERLPPEIVTLEVVETNALYKRSIRLGGNHVPLPTPIDLDVRLVADGKVFVRNRDFDSEWKGDVIVSGTSISPLIDGSLTLVRGELAALGLSLKATRGSIGFSASEKIDPSVDIVAESAANGITARVIVSGRASDPIISLESDPPLPPDEIASRLLFGDSPGQLSPAQSLQLAQALARLSGRRGVDPLGWVRRTAGLDLLQINSGEEGSETSVVSLGKYIKRGVFVSINQGFASRSSTANVAVDITDHVKIESEIGSNSTGSIGVTWGWDY